MAEKILVASGKGGVGKTSVTVGLGKALHKTGKKVLIIDCDMLRSVDLLTGVTEKLLYDWGDVILSRCEASEAVYTSSDVDVMTCPFSYEAFDGEKMKKLVRRSISAEKSGNFRIYYHLSGEKAIIAKNIETRIKARYNRWLHGRRIVCA